MNIDLSEVLEIIEIWFPAKEILSVNELIRKDSNGLFNFLYDLVKEEYKYFPLRKEGTDPFLHPVNVVFFLDKAKADDLTSCLGLIHDLIEEKVDLFKKRNHHGDDEEVIKILDNYEEKLISELERTIINYCQDQKITQRLIEPLKLLTRHKRHHYYRSIAEIFESSDQEAKERALQVKLADRLHNVQALDIFSERERIYQCFKNLFVLNYTKKYLLETDKITEGDLIYPTEENTTEKLYRKCCKGTYKAFLTICDQTLAKGIKKAEVYIQLAFEKFAFMTAGLWEVTDWDESEVHLLKLFQGIIRKYDARLHGDLNEFERRKKREVEYSQRFFSRFNLTPEQIEAIIDYKDAYALKEVTGRLLYQKRYTLSGFESSKLCCH